MANDAGKTTSGSITTKKEQPKQEPAVVQKLALAKTNLQARLPKSIDPERFYLGILTAIQKSKATAKEGSSLLDCDPNSVLLAAYDAAEVGCSLSPSLQLGWLIPYGKECNFQPSYRFYIQKSYETGEVSTFYAEVVYECDKLERQFAPKRNLFHAPGNPNDRNKEHAIGAYALIEFKDGVIDWEYLTKEQIERHRNKSKQPNSMKWLEFWEEGWRITPIRVLSKRLPLKGKEFEHLVELVNKDAERDIIIAADEILEPAIPREKQIDAKSEGKPAEAATPQEKKAEPKPAEPETKEPKEPKKEQPKETPKETPKDNPGNPGQGSLLQGDEADPLLSGAEVSDFWKKAFAANWKKTEVAAFLEKEFKATGPKDLRRSQASKAIELISQAKE